jgi:hypothetical protein
MYILSQHAKDVIQNRVIKEQWINETIKNPSLVTEVSENEIHYYKTIIDNDNRCLKVVINPIKKLVVTTYFDRGMRKRGCK